MQRNILDFRSDLEEAFSWRILEYNALKNSLREEDKFPIIKTLVVMLYAHFEGFFKDCLELYIQYINSSEKILSEFNDAIIAAALTREYGAFENINRKCKELTSVPPAEAFLHKFHRRKELTKVFTSNYLNKKIRIDEQVINTKSNLDYGVLQENLYILGLDYNKFEDSRESINKLITLRNSVAHGSQKNPIEFDELEKIENDIINVINDIIQYLYEVCLNEQFLR